MKEGLGRYRQREGILNFIILILENIRSTEADECGSAKRSLMNTARLGNFGLLFASFTWSSSCQKEVGDWFKL